MAELADALVSGSSEAIHVGSSPVVRTNKRDTALVVVSFFVFARAVTQNPLASTARDSGDVCHRQTRRIDTKWISMFNLPVVRTKKYCRKGYVFCSIFLSKSQTWYIIAARRISSRFSVYIITEGVLFLCDLMIYSPESEICSFLDGLYAISYEIDDIQNSVLVIYRNKLRMQRTQ